jgi:proline iminopeptidase
MNKYLHYAGYLALAGIAMYLMTVFIPRTYDDPLPASLAGMQYWQLSTGSRIAYVKLPARTPVRATPVIYLHGGPGGFITDRNVQALAPLTDDGYDVYLYDQIGGGQSDRLPDIGDYTATRHVRDLAEIIKTIGAGKVILVGQSWGAILAALFAADHPEQVDRIVFTGPGPLPPIRAERKDIAVPDSLALRAPMYSNRQANRQCANMRSKAMAWWARSLGIRIASDREADAFQSYLNSGLNKSIVCDTANAPGAEAGGGFYAQVMTVQSLAHVPDPREELKNSKIPVLVIRGQCDSQPWGFASEYLELFPDHRLTIIPDAGHAAYVEQPGLYTDAIRTFMAGDTSARGRLMGMAR